MSSFPFEVALVPGVFAKLIHIILRDRIRDGIYRTCERDGSGGQRPGWQNDRTTHRRSRRCRSPVVISPLRSSPDHHSNQLLPNLVQVHQTRVQPSYQRIVVVFNCWFGRFGILQISIFLEVFMNKRWDGQANGPCMSSPSRKCNTALSIAPHPRTIDSLPSNDTLSVIIDWVISKSWGYAFRIAKSQPPLVGVALCCPTDSQALAKTVSGSPA